MRHTYPGCSRRSQACKHLKDPLSSRRVETEFLCIHAGGSVAIQQRLQQVSLIGSYQGCRDASKFKQFHRGLPPLVTGRHCNKESLPRASAHSISSAHTLAMAESTSSSPSTFRKLACC